MSDLFEVREKTERGAQWRGTISVTIDDEQKELTVRQLRDPEFWEVMSSIDTDEFENLQTELPEETMDEYEELQNKDSLTEDERERLDDLQEEVENADVNIFDVLSRDTYEGLKQAAKYGVEPDEADVQTALTQHVNEIEDKNVHICVLDLFLQVVKPLTFVVSEIVFVLQFFILVHCLFRKLCL